MQFFQFITSKVFLKQLAIAVVVLGVFIFITFKWLTITTNHNQKIQVPNLAKKQLDEVDKILGELSLKWIVIDSASYNPNYPKKSVISQTPEEGDFVKEYRKIYLTLNPSGYKKIKIPNLLGKTKRQVTSQLKAIGFRISDKNSYVSDIAKDVVRGLKYKGKRLKVGDEIPKNSLITLVLGDGRGRSRYIQPSSDKN
ncbi:PASTA domain-containing protein [Lutibacter sp.]